MKPIDHEMEQGTDKHSQCSKFIPNLSSVYRQFLSHIANHLETCPIPASFQVVPWLLAVEWYKKRRNNNIWDCSNKRFILAKNAGIFWEIQNKLTATDWKKKFHPVGFFIDFGFVSALEEWAGSPLAHLSRTWIVPPSSKQHWHPGSDVQA